MQSSFVFYDALSGIQQLYLKWLYAWQVLSYLVVFFAQPIVDAARFAYPSDNLLHLPGRQKRCRACKKTITKFDHHCIWISGCVAAGNQMQFICFLASTIIINFSHGCYCVVFLIEALSQPLGGPADGMSLNALHAAGEATTIQLLRALAESFTPVAVQAVMFFIISVALIPFTLGQIKNVVQNRTTFERLKSGRLCLDVLSGRRKLVKVS